MFWLATEGTLTDGVDFFAVASNDLPESVDRVHLFTKNTGQCLVCAPKAYCMYRGAGEGRSNVPVGRELDHVRARVAAHS